MRLSNRIAAVDIPRDIKVIMIDTVRKSLTINLIPYHCPKRRMTNGIAQSAGAPVAFTYTVNIEKRSVTIQNTKQYIRLLRLLFFVPMIKTRIHMAKYTKVTIKFFAFAGLPRKNS
jgi:hypothetical protein